VPGNQKERKMLTHPIALGAAVFFGLMTVRNPEEGFVWTAIGSLITAAAATISFWPSFS
jgi:hypothetical protein